MKLNIFVGKLALFMQLPLSKIITASFLTVSLALNAQIERSPKIDLSQLIAEGYHFVYHDDSSHAVARAWQYKGKPKSKNGKYYTFYKNGQIKIQGQYAKGKMHGEFKWFYPNRNLKAKIDYKDNLKHGKRVGYYESGALKNESAAFKGKAEGISKYYYENGRLFYSGNYIGNKLNGKRRYYDKSGKPLNGTDILVSIKYKKISGDFIDGFPDGLITHFDENNNKVLEVDYDNGNADGLYKYFNKKGELKLIEEYSSGKFVRELSVARYLKKQQDIIY
jgi:antitoxin component YwqK of YwqJK toxin-antitoxin module